MSERSGRVSGGASVEFRHVSKRFGGRGPGPEVAAVNDLTLMVRPGEICVLVGPSGCGKTTSLKMVNRLIEPSDGTILIDGEDITRGDPVALRRRIGYVIQQVGLFPHRTVTENIATVPELTGWSKSRIHERVDELLTLVGLEPAGYRDRYPSQLSGGERQRVGVARAMAIEPPLMLMDEPFGAVDPIVRERLQDEFIDLQHRVGITVLMVTHDIDEAIKLGTRVAVFERGGSLAQYSDPAALLMEPASDYVARFVGADPLSGGCGECNCRVTRRAESPGASIALRRFRRPPASAASPIIMVPPQRSGAVIDLDGRALRMGLHSLRSATRSSAITRSSAGTAL
ncbi:MAG: ATP-binding cassette domain-containing protein [Dehalococcoidia bacterium]